MDAYRSFAVLPLNTNDYGAQLFSEPDPRNSAFSFGLASVARAGYFVLSAKPEQTMHDLKWSESEKKLSRSLFQAALEAELAEVLAEFKSKVAAATTAEEMWAIQEYLARKQRNIDEKYDYRYSQLIFVFGRLVREGRLQEEQLNGLSEEKLSYIRRIVSL